MTQRDTELLTLLKQARTALKIKKPDVALARVRAAIDLIEVPTGSGGENGEKT